MKQDRKDRMVMSIVNIEGHVFDIDMNLWKNEILNKIRNNIKDYPEMDLEKSYFSATEEIKSLLETITEIDETILLKIIHNKKSKKSKWVKYEFENPNSAHNISLKTIKEAFNLPNTCIDNCNSYEDYKLKIEKKMLDWKKDKNSYLTDFFYFSSKKKVAKESGILIDIKIDILNKIIESEKNNNNKNQNKQYEFQLNSLTNIPIDTTNRVKMTQQNDKYTYQYGSNNKQLEYYINLKDIKGVGIVEQAGKAIEQVFKVLNDYDVKLFEFILKNRTSTFFQDGKVSIVIKDASEYVFGYTSTTKKDYIISSLIKMASLRVYAFVDKDKEKELNDIGIKGMTTSLLSNDMVFDNDAGKNIVTVIVGDIYRSEIINGNITKVYSHILEEVKDNADARKLLFFLQRERIIKYYNRDKNDISGEYLRDRVHYTYFSQSILFTNKRKDIIKKRIQKGLDLIVKTNSVLNIGLGKGDFFDLEYNPMSEQEIIDLENRFIT